MSGLAAMVLENSITQALRAGCVPLVALRAMVLMALDEGVELSEDCSEPVIYAETQWCWVNDSTP